MRTKAISCLQQIASLHLLFPPSAQEPRSFPGKIWKLSPHFHLFSNLPPPSSVFILFALTHRKNRAQSKPDIRLYLHLPLSAEGAIRKWRREGREEGKGRKRKRREKSRKERKRKGNKRKERAIISLHFLLLHLFFFQCFAKLNVRTSIFRSGQGMRWTAWIRRRMRACLDLWLATHLVSRVSD